MRGLPVLVVAAAACGGDGIHIEIRPGDAPDVTRVELYLTDKTECRITDDLQCTQIVLPNEGSGPSRITFDGDLYQVDDPTPFHSDVVDGSAWFYLAPDNGEIKLAVAIGRGDGGDVIATRILTQKMDTAAGEQYFRADLRAVDSRLDQGEVAAIVWPESGDVPYHCVAAVEGNQKVAIVPAKDPDCDFVPPELECRATIHNANVPPSQLLEELTCAVPGSVPSVATNVCLLGDTGCNETDPMPVRCVTTPVPICVPDVVCSPQCQGKFDDDCVAQLGDPNGTRLHCTFPMSKEASGEVTPCNVTPINPLSLGNAVCDPLVEIMPLFTPLNGFGPSLDIVTQAGTATMQPAIAGGCGFLMQPPTTVFSDDVFPVLEQGLVKFSVTQPGNAASRIVILPIDIEMHVDPTGTCNEQPKCVPVNAPNERVSLCFSGG